MLAPDALPHDAEFEICGRVYEFPRSLAMLRRAEKAIGPVVPFAVKLDQRAVLVDDVARVYAAFVREQPGAPTQEEIAAWVFARGLGHRDLAAYLFSLAMSSDEIERVTKARGLNERGTAEGEGARGPFAPTAPPTGPTSTASGTSSDGPPPRPAPIHFTS